MSYIKTGRNLLSCKPKYILLNEKVVSKNITALKWLKIALEDVCGEKSDTKSDTKVTTEMGGNKTN